MRDWKAAAAAVTEMKTAWARFRAGEVPRLLEPLMTPALGSLERSVRARDVASARQAAIDVARWSLDLQLRYRPPTQIDLARLGLWAQQLQVDAAAADANSVNGDVFTLFYLRDRILKTLAPANVTALNGMIGTLQVVSADKELDTAAKTAGKLRELVSRIEATGS